jgi:2-C-methyl-D-erythritol 4-phosphate cytidylyltransferase
LQNVVLIVAGGSGTRMNSGVPKQFMPLCGKPILLHTIERFVNALPDAKIVLVLAKAYINDWQRICEQHHFSYPIQVVDGGHTRFHSVKNGLALVPDHCVVGIHDAARPLVSQKTIRNAFETAAQQGNASPSIALNESIRLVENNNNKALDRSLFRIIQTPQCFQAAIIKKAFEQVYQAQFTDDASVAEAAGETIMLVEGNNENIKITTPQDLLIAEALLKML